MTTTEIANTVAYTQNGRNVTYKEVTTQDLLASAVNRKCALAQTELTRRGIDWAAYL